MEINKKQEGVLVPEIHLGLLTKLCKLGSCLNKIANSLQS